MSAGRYAAILGNSLISVLNGTLAYSLLDKYFNTLHFAEQAILNKVSELTPQTIQHAYNQAQQLAYQSNAIDLYAAASLLAGAVISGSIALYLAGEKD